MTKKKTNRAKKSLSTAETTDAGEHLTGEIMDDNSSQSTQQHIPIVGIGASAGGLDAFKQLFEAMPSDTGMAFVLIQHLDPTHKSLMVDLLSRHTAMKVVQVENRMPVESNYVYMIPPNYDLAIRNGELYITPPAQKRGLRMPINFFFSSLAEDQRERAVCIILSGTGSDGTLGLKAIKSYGGMAMAQSPNTAQYDGMPVSAISTGAVDYVLPVNEMPEAILKYINHSYVRGRWPGTDMTNDTNNQDLNNVLAILHAQLGHNFHHYKKNTLTRRVQRRMGLKQIERMLDYVTFLRDNPAEIEELFNDMLIGVTHFFRDRECWELLDEILITSLVRQSSPETSLRVWVAGCSTGEEAYTMAMLLMENFNKLNKKANFQVFATDIDIKALEHARSGRYPQSIATDLSPDRLNRFFVNKDDYYYVSKQLRDKIIFSEQNLISDPPFSKLDLISCRNLLIYLEAEVQDKVIELFHFALRPGGHLLLGNSETIGHHIDLFETLSKKWRFFQRIDSAQPQRASFPILPGRLQNRPAFYALEPTVRAIKPVELVNTALLDHYAPTTVLINRKKEILYHFGETVKYLRYPTGEPTSDLFAVIRDGLVTKLRGAIYKCVQNDEDIIVSDARLKRNGKYVKISFSVISLTQYKGGTGLFLICFEEGIKKSGSSVEQVVSGETEEPIVQQLEYELSSTKEDLQNTIEELETSNEELKASNEEVMSMNEELQSSNEELETSKEELQSLNEELNTVNSELQDKVSILVTTNNDLNNLINSTSVAAIFLSTRFHINFFSPTAKKLFNLIASDIGRSLDDITPHFSDPDLHHDSEMVLETLRIKEKEIKTESGEWFHRKILPYRTSDNRIEGIVLTFENITRLKKNQFEIVAMVDEQTRVLRKKSEMLMSIFSSIHVMSVHLDDKYTVLAANDLFIKRHKLDAANVVGMKLFSLAPISKDEKNIIARALTTGEEHFIFASERTADKLGDDCRLYDWVIKPLKNNEGKTVEILLSIIDVTEREREIAKAKKQQDQSMHTTDNTTQEKS
ncbi:PAS domain-containing protein [Desulforhopalus vacuolatus]|uniref:chemotaxis protein CheB n=1 Tax=Desulforhopalus vacuolatus TaxID=40414 RepID=UPI0019665803|nr:chemotaxis protein CheB [Desulforhopalus vacuolatus]MBM9520376.1 PAS domain-containing protein [Desulforhopalus vacuolatus]